VAIVRHHTAGYLAESLEAEFRLRQDQDLEVVALLGIIEASHQVSRKYHLRIVRDPMWPLKNTERRAKQRAGYFSPPMQLARFLRRLFR
jgi:hypothetical protein